MSTNRKRAANDYWSSGKAVKKTTPTTQPNENSWFKKQEWLKEKAKDVALPTAEAAKLVLGFMFEDPISIFTLCIPCRIKNRTATVTCDKDGRQEFPFSLCTICAAHNNTQRRTKYFQFELPVVKRRCLAEDGSVAAAATDVVVSDDKDDDAEIVIVDEKTTKSKKK